jgi:palmitoyltransferase
MSDGYVFKRRLSEDRQKDTNTESPWTRWPVESQQIVLRTEDGMPPRGAAAIGVGEWERVWKLRDVENLYDLGFKDNLKDVFWPRYGFHLSEQHVSSTPSLAQDENSPSVS